VTTRVQRSPIPSPEVREAEERTIEEFIRQRGVTQCPPRSGFWPQQRTVSIREAIARLRGGFRKTQK
jgi:hypothetical protein